MKYIAKGYISKDGIVYGEGQEIELTKEQAEQPFIKDLIEPVKRVKKEKE